MEEFLRVLYEYAQDKGITPYLETREYRRVVNSLEEGWTAFCDGLTAEQSRQLDTLLV